MSEPQKRKSYLTVAAQHVRDVILLCGTLALLTTLTLNLWGEEISDYIDREIGGVCTHIPAHGHTIRDAYAGEWTTVDWQNIVRLRDDCGPPILTGLISNGGGFLHEAPLSIPGIDLPEGSHDLSYLFRIDERVECGAAGFRVDLIFPNAPGGAPPAKSAWVPFNVLCKHGERPKHSPIGAPPSFPD